VGKTNEQLYKVDSKATKYLGLDRNAEDDQCLNIFHIWSMIRGCINKELGQQTLSKARELDNDADKG
tara:strand:+ start:266 stop:466 length:201 start_codon:yes stop_codon:yes gene_type:complete